MLFNLGRKHNRLRVAFYICRNKNRLRWSSCLISLCILPAGSVLPSWNVCYKPCWFPAHVGQMFGILICRRIIARKKTKKTNNKPERWAVVLKCFRTFWTIFTFHEPVTRAKQDCIAKKSTYKEPRWCTWPTWLHIICVDQQALPGTRENTFSYLLTHPSPLCTKANGI